MPLMHVGRTACKADETASFRMVRDVNRHAEDIKPGHDWHERKAPVSGRMVHKKNNKNESGHLGLVGLASQKVKNGKKTSREYSFSVLPIPGKSREGHPEYLLQALVRCTLHKSRSMDDPLDNCKKRSVRPGVNPYHITFCIT